MKTRRSFPEYRISRKGENWLKTGHPWVYEDEIRSGEAEENGALVDVLSEKGRYLGTGLLSNESRIRIRLVSRNANDRFDHAFWERRFRYAIKYRKKVMGKDFNACRLIFGEADEFPGLTVDKFEDLLVAQTLSYGMEQRKKELFPILMEVLEEEGSPVRGLYERNDDGLRDKEGLMQGKGWFGVSHPAETTTEIVENNLRFFVDVENGQKTGFFLDQKYNRRRVRDLAQGMNVLDCCTHTGAFALNAAAGGAVHVDAVDVSNEALEMASRNAALNGLQDKITWTASDVFDFLEESLSSKKHPYDFIILDPPAFAKSRSAIPVAEKGYRRLNREAMRLLMRGGYLATCSCSHFMDTPRFLRAVEEAAKEAHVSLRQIEARQQAPDHPIRLGIPETDYLKFFLFQVV